VFQGLKISISVSLGVFLLGNASLGLAQESPAETQAAATKTPMKANSHPAFTTESRTDVMEEGEFYPCSDCHDGVTQKPNPKIRQLEEEHDTLELKHGNDTFWCLTCHNNDERDFLIGLKGERISFNEPYTLCSQCHSPRAKDFFRGGHGKRLDTWDGERVLKTCVGCHNPHEPSIKPRQPVALPLLRKGLIPANIEEIKRQTPWETIRISRGWKRKQ
jgi:uncharacterized CHY-type Zn-finger protein